MEEKLNLQRLQIISTGQFLRFCVWLDSLIEFSVYLKEYIKATIKGRREANALKDNVSTIDSWNYYETDVCNLGSLILDAALSDRGFYTRFLLVSSRA